MAVGHLNFCYGMKKNIFTNVLMGVTFLSALTAFYSVSRAIRIPEASTWIVPMVWVSFFMIAIFSVSIFVRLLLAEMIVAMAMLLSLIFAPTLIHFGIVLVCIFFVLGGMRAIRSDLDLNVKINLWKSQYIGKFRIIFAVALLLSSQYFFIIKKIDGPVNVPRLDFSSISGRLVGPILGIINPGFAEASRKDLTVDEFIIQSQNDSQESFPDGDLVSEELIDANMPSNIPALQKEILKRQALSEMTNARSKLLEQNKELVLQEGRRQFSKISGKKINGDEKISVVFSGMINDKINTYFQPSINGDEKSSLFPMILAAVLFLTIWPLGSMISILWFGIVILIFKASVYFGLIEIKKVAVEREMID
ncbi:MAG: hypothetical protein US63_C0023G0001 [Candidatus Moranbacteria bacterium GW2011_GWC2_37_8]|nr:MAG: hypothetical protein US63_C0023G0001 [Candidatus Moranbacteria bacterium GW2011_GWC2_37_8]KKQ61264.1 MAG: hypothetical protein US82_C0023G0013 [Parcubacteria group bacterium GW2011_GWC1_38_22]